MAIDLRGLIEARRSEKFGLFDHHLNSQMFAY